MTRILVCHGKHGEDYWEASTDDDLAKSATAILKQRFNEGHWYYKPTKPTYNGLPLEEINALSDPDIRKVAVRKWNRYVSEKRLYRQEKEQWDMLAAEVNSPQPTLAAWGLLQYYGDYEYQLVTLEDVRSADDE